MKLMSLLLCVGLLAAPWSPTAARIPPVPEWPVIGPVLVRLGLVEPVRYPDPTLKVYTVTTMDELEALDERLAPNQRARIVVAEALAKSLIEDAFKDADFFKLTTLDFTKRGLLIGFELERARLEQGGVRIPLIKGERFAVSARLVFKVKDGYPQVRIRNLKVNGLPLPVGRLIEQRLNELSKEKWPNWVVLEAVFMSEDDVSIEGYYTEH